MSTSNLDPSQSKNDITLQSYQNRTQQYIEGTPLTNDALRAWIDECLSLIPKGGHILEVGSGSGRDAEYIQSRGFTIECSDAVPNFIELLRDKGLNARALNVLKDTIHGTYDMVFANGVLLHFTPQEAAQVTKKIQAILNTSGIFALRVKRGNGPIWTDAKLGEPRYFYRWQPEELKKMLTSCGFEWLGMAENRTSHNGADWMSVTAKKIS